MFYIILFYQNGANDDINLISFVIDPVLCFHFRL